MASSSRIPSIPPAQQAQIIRANQRDMIYVATLREQMEGAARSWLGSRRLSRWDKEIDLLAKLVYYGFVLKSASQTLGEEYTNIWQYSPNEGFPTPRSRAAWILLPTLPAYLISRYGARLSTSSSRIREILKRLPMLLEVVSEINLATFYFNGVYYSLAKRLLGIRHITSVPENPNTRPPSYSLLGILISVRLVLRLASVVRSFAKSTSNLSGKATEKGEPASTNEPTIDGGTVSQLLASVPDESSAPTAAENDVNTALDFKTIPEQIRERRNCTLCLEERTSSCATECGHLFCWTCIFGWGREKAECPLCRQSLDLTKLIPIYNL